MLQPHSQRGITLLELLLSFVVITALLFAATRYFEVTSENLKVTQAEEMINNVVNASYQWVQGSPDFSTITLQKLIDTGLLPQNYTGSKINPWHGDIGVKAWNANQIQVTMSNIPLVSCQNLKQKLLRYLDPNNNSNACSNTATTSTFAGVFNSQ